MWVAYDQHGGKPGRKFRLSLGHQTRSPWPGRELGSGRGEVAEWGREPVPRTASATQRRNGPAKKREQGKPECLTGQLKPQSHTVLFCDIFSKRWLGEWLAKTGRIRFVTWLWVSKRKCEQFSGISTTPESHKVKSAVPGEGSKNNQD